MGKIFAELKRRQMFRVAAAYAVVAWLLLQVINNVAPVLDLPPWVARAFLLALVIGFPIALLFVWMRDLAPSDAAVPRPATSKIDYALIAGLLLVIALISYQQLAPGGTMAPQARPTAPATQGASISVAVLPFANLSGDASQEFFSDGMTEEITSALARVPTLRLVGRSSAFQFKGQNRDLRAIGQALNATHLIEGSVRREGDRVRITAQLVKADDGLNVWIESYDRQLTSVFATQEDIARAIAAALRVPLGLGERQSLVSNRTADLDSYERYLRARALVRARGAAIPLRDVTSLLEQVVAQDSRFAPAWALLALAHAVAPGYDSAWFSGDFEELRRAANASLPKAEEAARRAIELDPNLADGYLSLAIAQHVRGKLLEAEELYLKALALDPNNSDVLHLYSQLLAKVGRLKDALTMRQQLEVSEPFVPVFNVVNGVILWLNGQTEPAISVLKEVPAGNPFGSVSLARIFAAAGRYGEAADVLQNIPPAILPARTVGDATRLLHSAPATATSPETLPRFGYMEFVYLHVGAPERVLEFYQGGVDAGFSMAGKTAWLWHPSYAAVRKTEGFQTLMRSDGLVDYWRARGWPEFCHPTAGDDFECS